MRWVAIKGLACIGPHPFILGPPLTRPQQSAIMGDFAYYLLMSRAILPSGIRQYIKEVRRVHSVHDFACPGTSPGFRLMDRRLADAAKACPDRRFAIAAVTLRLARVAQEPILADATVLMFFLAARPMECLTADSGGPDSLIASWHRVRWRTITGAPCHPLDPRLHYALVQLFRKGDTTCGHWVPLMFTGSAFFCGLRALLRLYAVVHQPHDPIIHTFSGSRAFVRRTHVSAFVQRLATAANLPSFYFTTYSLRRGYITAMAIAGVGKLRRMEFCGHRQSGSHENYVDPDPRVFRTIAARVALTIVESAGRR